jgi:hypothetical protein
LSNDEVIDRITTNFIPAAVNLFKVRRPFAEGGKYFPDAGSQLFRSIQQQKSQYQGIWIVSPEGKVLAGFHVPDVPFLDVLDAGLKAFGPVTPRTVKAVDPLPHRGVGVQPDGSVSLALYTRFLSKSQRDGPPTVDTLTLSAAEWAAMAPADGLKPGRWTVRQDVARKFYRILPPTSGQLMPLPDEIREAELKATVESANGSRTRIRFVGRWETEERRELPKYGPTFLSSTGEGEALYDSESGAILNFLLVCQGTQRVRSKDSTPRKTGAVVEWRWDARP